jgi:hypothetical protein
LHGDGSARPVDLAPLDRNPLVRAEARRGGEDNERPVDRPEFLGDRVDLLARERT